MPRREDPRGSLTTDRVIRWSNSGAQHHMSQSTPILIGVGFDTARYGHHVAFLRPDLQPAAPAFTFPESAAGYAQLRQASSNSKRNMDQFISTCVSTPQVNTPSTSNGSSGPGPGRKR